MRWGPTDAARSSETSRASNRRLDVNMIRTALLAAAVVVSGCANELPRSDRGLGGSMSASAILSSTAAIPQPTPRASSGVEPSPAAADPASPAPADPASPAIGQAGPAGGLLFLRNGIEGSRNGSAWLVPASRGKPRRLGSALELSWSADGTVIHLVRQDRACKPHLVTMTPTRSVLSIVDRGLRSEDGGFSWSPDGRRVVFFRFHYGAPPKMCGSQGGTYGAKAMLQDLMVMNADGSGQRILKARIRYERPGSWSPDGTRIAFARPTGSLDQNLQELVIVRVRDGRVRRVGAPTGQSLNSPRWSPDGADLAFTFYRDDAWHAAVVGIDGHGLVDLGAPGRNDGDPTWAPDSSRVATAHEIVDGGTVVGGALSLCPVDGARPSDLGVTDVQTYGGPPTWSPDGRWLAYLRTSDAGGLAGIVVIGADGRRPTQVPDTAGAATVSWQP